MPYIWMVKTRWASTLTNCISQKIHALVKNGLFCKADVFRTAVRHSCLLLRKVLPRLSEQVPLASLLLQYKSGRLYVMMAGFMVGLGYIGMSFCLTSSVWLMLLMTSISGFGHAIINIATITSLRACFEESTFATLYSLCNTMTTVGLGTLPIIFDSLQRHYGIQGALFIFGAILWHTVVIGLLLKPKVPLNKATNETYFRKSGSSLCSRDGIFDIFIAHKAFPILLMVTTLFEANFHGWALYLVPYCQSTGVPSSTAVLLTIIVGVSGFMGKLLMCLLASLDVLHPIMIVVSCFVIALSYTILFVWNSFLGFAVVSAVSGFCCGLTSTHIVCECNRIVCKQHFKSGISWTIFCRTISVATGGIVLGYIRDVSGEFTYAFGFLLILCVMCGFMATFLCLPKLKRTTDCG
ncbi:monocarboxylate transporter 12-B-like isoform X2 [Apostichopus japonicus]|uniref:monocarboxylate transporter 12-B-like isoform X2 n=1 Tax=Stichopus japonicus TaxID=307972 RepID=UPI003AB28F48